MKTEVKDIIQELGGENFMYEDFPPKYKDITINCVEQYGGEGLGDDYYSVISFSKADETVYVKFYGLYTSFYGSEYTNYQFVNPKQKTITVYE